MSPDQFSIILVEPQGPINIGAVCRTMMNFGFTRLRLVNPCKHYKSLIAKKMALSAMKVLESAQIFGTLGQALEDIQIAFGTTRRFGKYRKTFFTPEAAAQKVVTDYPQTACALVMGPEDTGLQTHDLDLCQHFITIPTHDMYPSMNLSHSLSILLYELSMAMDPDNVPRPTPKKLAAGQELEQMYQHMRQTLT
ncbi:MAG: RNA methyltransferase, partial [Desulfobacteraceae bacterium]